MLRPINVHIIVQYILHSIIQTGYVIYIEAHLIISSTQDHIMKVCNIVMRDWGEGSENYPLQTKGIRSSCVTLEQV